jgi:hypothetical protein
MRVSQDETEETMLTGTFPVFPFGEQFCGFITHDGQRARVVALACESDGKVIFLSLVGSDTTTSSIFASLQKRETLLFEATVAWSGPLRLIYPDLPMHNLSELLVGVPVYHAVTLVEAADIGAGIRGAPLSARLAAQPPDAVPPDTAQESPATETPSAEMPSPASATVADEHTADLPGKDEEAVTPPSPRYILGNASEATPARAAFLGHLKAIRLPVLPEWADALWDLGLAAGSIAPLPAVGIAAWRLSTDLPHWGGIIRDALTQGILAIPHD